MRCKMSESKTKSKVHVVSIPGMNNIGTKRFRLLRAVAEKAAAAFRHKFYLEAITLTESLLATRLESRLTWVRHWQKKNEATEFNTLGRLCTELLHGTAKAAPDYDDFEVAIRDIREWAKQRNEAL